MYAFPTESTATPATVACALMPRYVQYFKLGAVAVATGRKIARNPSLMPPPYVDWNGPGDAAGAIVRFVDCVSMATKIFPEGSMAIPPGPSVASLPFPPKSVE